MNKVIIITDSTCDLMPDYIKEHNVVVLPLYVNFGDTSYRDGVDITTPKLYEMVEEKQELPKTAAISVGDFVDVFEKYLNEGFDVVYTGISSFMSSTYNNAILAAGGELDKRIFVVDSKNLSTGIGLLVLKMVKMRDLGMSASEIALEANKIVPRIRSQFAIKKFDYLYKGGRCSTMSAIFGSVLSIKPIIEVRDGKMTVGKKPMGKMKRALDVMLEMIDKDKDNVDLDCIMITHSIADDSCEYLKNELSKRYDSKILMETHAGCVISSHCGEGTIGILYILNE